MNPKTPPTQSACFRSLLLAIVAVGLAGCSSMFKPPQTYFPPADKDLDTFIPAADLTADLDDMVRTLQETHLNLYHHIPEEDFQREVAHVVSSLTEPLTREQFYWRVTPLVTLVGDGHTGILYPAEHFTNHVTAGGTVFPIDTRISSGTLVVVSALSGAERPTTDSVLLSIQGMDCAGFVSRLLSVQSTERPEFAEERAVGMIKPVLHETLGAPASWNVQWREPSGEVRGADFPSLTRAQVLEARARIAPQHPPAPYSFRRLEGQPVGVIDFRSMTDEEKFGRFLEESFARARSENLEAMIIDLRQNGGGNSSLGDMLLAHLTDKPFRSISRMDVRSSRQYRAYLKGHAPWYIRWLPIQYLDEYGRILWDVPAGGVASIEGPEKAPPAPPNRFTGPAYFLVGPRTYSSATMLAETVKDCHLGTLVGEETGGLACSYGEIYGFTLPHSRLYVTSSVKYFVRPSGIDDGRGVLPDIPVRDIPGNATDEALEEVLNRVGSERGSSQ